MIKKVAVIGAGVMGSGIAAQIVNNNVDVLLFDLENDEGLIAEQSINKLVKAQPSQLAHPIIAEKILPLSLNKDLEKLKECDLIIEAIIENLNIKQQFYKNAYPHLKESCILASNTSTFTLSQLTENLESNLKSKMVILHFFNPPRYMRLLEFIPGNLNQRILENLKIFLQDKIGKDVIICKDTPGFIANRLGCYLMELVLQESLKIKADINAVDQIFNKLLGFPSTGIFGLYDLIGLDVMALISESLNNSLAQDDEFCMNWKPVPQLTKMIENGYNGRKGKGGFYVVNIGQNGRKTKSVLNLANFNHQEITPPKNNYQDLQQLLNSNDALAGFFKNILDKFFSYVLKVRDVIASDIYSIDKAMQLGFAWKYGPFEMMEKFKLVPTEYASSFKSFNINKEKFGINPKALADLVKEHNLSPLKTSNSSNTWQLKNNKICFEITSKMHVLNSQVFDSLIEAVNIAETQNADLIIYSDFNHFSAGADLNLFYESAINHNFDECKKLLHLGQEAMLKLKYSKIPVISCPRGVALGGGCEILLHSDYIVAHQDISAGLVETSIGLIPGWGGVKEMVLKSNNEQELMENLTLILEQYKSSSALDFAIKFKHKNVISIAGNDNLLSYVLTNDFNKQSYSRDAHYPVSKIEFDNSNYPDDIKIIAQILLEKLHGNLTENDLLNIEQEIFITLLNKQNALSKIAKLIAK